MSLNNALVATAAGDFLPLFADPRWVDWLQAYGTRSPNTLDAYARDMRGFAYYVQHEMMLDDLRELRVEHCIGYPGYLKEQQGLKASTIARKLSAVRSALDYAVALGILDRNPMQTVKGYRVPSLSPRVALDDADVERLLKAIPRKTLKGKRDYAIVVTFLFTGLRRAELVALRGEMFNVEKRILFVQFTGKGGADRLLAIVPRVEHAILEYLKADGREVESLAALAKSEHAGELLFRVSQRIEERTGKPVAGTTVWRLVTRYATRAGVTTDVHTLRHTAASAALDGGAELKAVQTMMGHKNIGTTSRYLTRKQDLADSAVWNIHVPTADEDETSESEDEE